MPIQHRINGTLIQRVVMTCHIWRDSDLREKMDDAPKAVQEGIGVDDDPMLQVKRVPVDEKFEDENPHVHKVLGEQDKARSHLLIPNRIDQCPKSQANEHGDRKGQGPEQGHQSDRFGESTLLLCRGQRFARKPLQGTSFEGHVDSDAKVQGLQNKAPACEVDEKPPTIFRREPIQHQRDGQKYRNAGACKKECPIREQP